VGKDKCSENTTKRLLQIAVDKDGVFYSEKANRDGQPTFKVFSFDCCMMANF